MSSPNNVESAVPTEKPGCLPNLRVIATAKAVKAFCYSSLRPFDYAQGAMTQAPRRLLYNQYLGKKTRFLSPRASRTIILASQLFQLLQNLTPTTSHFRPSQNSLRWTKE
jgi:hypothetical protein